MCTISPNLEIISPKIEKRIQVKAEDKEALLFDFLSEFLFIFDVNELIFNHIEVTQIEKLDNGFKLEAIAKGEKFDRNKHEIGTEVKAITYSFMKIEEKKDYVEIEIVFDI
jgi:SHS2 domain-containing protein